MLVFYIIAGVIITVILIGVMAFAAPAMVVVAAFSPEVDAYGIPKGWQAAWFDFSPRRTRYTVENDKGKWVLRAESKNSASAIYKEISVAPKDYPVLTWRWKVSNIIKKGDENRKEGDDYAARLYVSFEYRHDNTSLSEMLKRRVIKAVYGKELPGDAIVYVWANRLAKNKAVPNPDTDKAMMLAVESGPENVGVWISERRNVFEDYKNLFGIEPPRMAYIALMTDTDNTGEEVSAWYDGIIFHAGDGASAK